MLDPNQPPTTYHLHRTREWTGSSGQRKYIYTAREYSDKYAMYMLESSHRGDSQVNAADFFRVAEYPQTCISIMLSGDRQQKIPWSPRRFTYGGRRFVWKAGDPHDDTMPETLYEYQKDWAKPGSRTGKRCDDARPMTKLVWGEKKKQGKLDSYTIHFKGGMDQVFRELLLASQMARQVCLFRAVD
jgi:hypothetical protein